jgi:4-amino-4-deoxy-L-arabinose transferase-like glycosyltransferase
MTGTVATPDEVVAPAPDAPHDPTWFRPALMLIVLGALAVRVAYVLISRRNFDPGGDAYFYHAGANLLAEGKGFISPFYYQVGIHRAAAEHPPLYIIFLAIPSVLGMKSILVHLLWSCLLGAATVGLVGLVGNAVAGPRVGVIAAVIAALYPNIWAADGQLQAETLSMFAATLTLWLAYRYWQRPGWKRLVLVGLACGFGALARSELLLFVPFLVVPLALATRERSWADRLRWLGASACAAILVIAPWTIYNTTRFVHPVLLSAQFDNLLAAANCDSTYYGIYQGYFDINCSIAIDKAAGLTEKDDESQEDVVFHRAAVSYIRGHMSELPHVEATRLLRIVGLYHPAAYVHADNYVEGRDPIWVVWAGLYSFWMLALLSIAGAVVLRRRANSPPLYPLLAPIFAVIVTVLITYASTRFRTTAEPAIAVLAAIAIDAALLRTRNGYASARN